MRRGEIRMFKFPFENAQENPDGHRGVIVGRHDDLDGGGHSIAVLITSTGHAAKWEVELDECDGLPGRCFANCTSIATFPANQVHNPNQEAIAFLSEEKMEAIDCALAFGLGIDKNDQQQRVRDEEFHNTNFMENPGSAPV